MNEGMLPPNPAEQANPPADDWLQLHNIWAGSKISPSLLRPEYVDYVDPDGTATRSSACRRSATSATRTPAAASARCNTRACWVRSTTRSSPPAPSIRSIRRSSCCTPTATTTAAAPTATTTTTPAGWCEWLQEDPALRAHHRARLPGALPARSGAERAHRAGLVERRRQRRSAVHEVVQPLRPAVLARPQLLGGADRLPERGAQRWRTPSRSTRRSPTRCG